MEPGVCFMFGHADTSPDVQPLVEEAAERLYLENGIRIFVVGSRGSFDRMAAAAVRKLKKTYQDASLQLLLAYHPAERPVDLPEGFDSSYYPPLEGVPRRYAITRANRYMISQADAALCYVCHVGNARNLLEYARRRGDIYIENIAQVQRNGCITPENVL